MDGKYPSIWIAVGHYFDFGFVIMALKTCMWSKIVYVIFIYL